MSYVGDRQTVRDLPVLCNKQRAVVTEDIEPFDGAAPKLAEKQQAMKPAAFDV